MPLLLPEPIVDSLLSALGNDDEFRDRFATDARAALASLGFEPAADPSIRRGIWNCMEVTRLATKEAIRSAHAELRAQLLRTAMYTPFQLEDAAASLELAA